MKYDMYSCAPAAQARPKIITKAIAHRRGGLKEHPVDRLRSRVAVQEDPVLNCRRGTVLNSHPREVTNEHV